MTTPRQNGTNPRANGTNPRAQGTNPRTVTRTEFDELRADVRQILRLVQRIAGTTEMPQVRHLDDRTMFLPGTGTLAPRTLTPTAQAALDHLEHLEHQDQP